MSYILDALKRADAERGLSVGATTADVTPQAHGHPPTAPWWRSRTGVIVWLALLCVTGLAALWWPSSKLAAPTPAASTDPSVSGPALPSAQSPDVATAPVPQATPNASVAPRTGPMPTPVAPSSTPSPDASPSSTAAAARPAPILLPERPMAARPSAPVPAQVAAASTGAAFGPDPVPPMPSAVTRQPAPTPPPAAPTAGATATPSAPMATGAPASAPPVKVTGATYSDNPAHRMLIVNGKIVLEGQQIEPGLTLEVITPHSAVLNHQGSRFNINY